MGRPKPRLPEILVFWYLSLLSSFMHEHNGMQGSAAIGPSGGVPSPAALLNLNTSRCGMSYGSAGCAPVVFGVTRITRGALQQLAPHGI